MKAAIQAPPRAAGIELADWNWKVVRGLIRRRCGLPLSRASRPNDPHRLGFVLERPEKRLLEADAARREVFARECALPRAGAGAGGAELFFVDEAHSYADADLRGKWVLEGEPAPADSTSPRRGEKASHYSAVCPETGVRSLQQLRAGHPEPLTVIWDAGPARGGEALRTYLGTPDLRLRLVRLPADSPDFNADEAIWGWAREEVTANTCFGTTAKAREAVGQFPRALTDRTEEVKRRCRTVLQARAEARASVATDILQHPQHGDPTLALV